MSDPPAAARLGFVFAPPSSTTETRHFSLFPNARLQHLLFATSVFCCWMMWAIIYMAQMNPLVVPVLSGPE